MKKIFIIIITACLLITIICLSVGAVSHNNGEAGTGEFLPWLNYTVTAETDTTNIVLFGAPVLSSTYREYMQTLSEYQVNDQNYALPYIDIESLGLTKVTSLDLYKGTIAYRVPELAGDNVTPIETIGNTVTFSPFSIKREFAFDSLNINISDIIGSFNWYGIDIVDTTIVFRMDVDFVYTNLRRSSDEGDIWYPTRREYQLEYVQQSYDGYFWGTEDIEVSEVSVYNVTDNEYISYADFISDLNDRDMYVENDDVWLDVSNMEIDFTYSGGGTAQFVHQNALYANRDIYNGANDASEGNITSNTIGARQNYGNSEIIAYKGALNRQQSYSRELFWQVEGDTVIDGIGDRLGSMIGIFTKTVGAVLDVDLFGFGITLGDITFVMILALVVVIFLRLFAGG